MTSQSGPYSHPPEGGHEGVLLLDHLRDVRDRVKYTLPNGTQTPWGESVIDVVERLALVHDLGKATKFFQQYLDVIAGKPNVPQKRYHSPLGAFAAYFVLDTVGFHTETCVSGFVAVAKHHGRLPDVPDYLATRATQDDHSERLNVIRVQLKSILDTAPEIGEKVFAEATDDQDAWEEFVAAVADGSLFEEIAGHVRHELSRSTKTDPFSANLYGSVLSCWGTLVLADKTSAAGAAANEQPYVGIQPATDVLEDYVRRIESRVGTDKSGTRPEQLNYYRSHAHDQVLDNVPRFVQCPENVATITLPTGLGKTLTGLHAALAIRDATNATRVVYALPFTSIIDQVADELGSIFDSDATDGLLATHHHLADTRMNPSGEEGYDAADRSDDVAGMLGESWRAGLTITTFVQLFESLAGPRNSQSKKLPALHDSVIILDEPQSLPLDWWKLVPRLVEILTEQYGATIISMTATQPELFPEYVELVDEVDPYFDIAERVQYQLHESIDRFLQNGTAAHPADYDTAADTIATDVRDGTAVLAICNTIDSARRLTDDLTSRVHTVDIGETYIEVLRSNVDTPVLSTVRAVRERSGAPFVHLSSRMRPTDRLALIKVVKDLRDRNEQVVAVSTQVVEAGVDVSFEALYRDLAPVDSIVQAAGRCNRTFEQDHGTSTVWWLAEPADQSNTPAVAVYDRGTALTPVTAAALDSVRIDGTTLSGSTVSRAAVTDYYERLHKDKNVGRDSYVNMVDEADGDSLASLTLIDTPRSIDVLVCRTATDDTLVDNIETAYDTHDYNTKTDLVKQTKPLRVSIPIYDTDSEEADIVMDLPPLAGMEAEADIRVLHTTSRQYADYFDATTGFVVPDNTIANRFL